MIDNSVYLTISKGENKMKKAAYGFLIYLLGTIVFSGIMMNASYRLNKDINGWKDRAQVSSEPNDMYEYMSNVEEGMEDWGMTTGYAAIIFKTPSNDMSLIYRTVQQHAEQAKVLTDMNRSSPEYQTGLDNLRGSIRELEIHAFAYWSVNSGLYMVFALLFFLIGTMAFSFIWLFKWVDGG